MRTGTDISQRQYVDNLKAENAQLRTSLNEAEAKVEKMWKALDRARVGQQALPKPSAEFWKGYWQGQIVGFEEALK